jgi:hypothetical protein
VSVEPRTQRRTALFVVSITLLTAAIITVSILRLAGVVSGGTGSHPQAALAVTIILALILAVGVIWLGPKWQVVHSQNLSSKNRFDRENEARKTLAQIVGGIFVLAGLYSSIQTFRLQTQSIDLQREGQITDRYIKAVQQLGTTDAQNLPVRVGAIFALERVARESKPDYWPIMELLSAYVRNRSNAPLSSEQLDALKNFPSIFPFAGPYLAVSGLANVQTPDKRAYMVLHECFRRGVYHNSRSWPNESAPEDVQAAMTVIGRRQLTYEDEPWHRLNLRYVNLQGLDLKDAHLEGADLEGANLHNTDLTGACLCGANLKNVLTYSTILAMSDLRRADLTGAVFLNNRDDFADVREAVVLWAKAPSLPAIRASEKDEPFLGFQQSDTSGIIIDKGIHPLSRSVVITEDDIPTLAPRPFPPAKSNSKCLQRMAPIWLSESGK